MALDRYPKILHQYPVDCGFLDPLLRWRIKAQRLEHNKTHPLDFTSRAVGSAHDFEPGRVGRTRGSVYRDQVENFCTKQGENKGKIGRISVGAYDCQKRRARQKSDTKILEAEKIELKEIAEF